MQSQIATIFLILTRSDNFCVCLRMFNASYFMNSVFISNYDMLRNLTMKLSQILSK